MPLCRYHWDLPQVLQDKYGGFLSEQIQRDFLYYADTLFKHLGDLVDQWITFNEVISICELGYQLDVFAPQANKGLAAKYTCGHNILLAHAKTIQLFRQKYRPLGQRARFSIALDGKWGYPRDPNNPAGEMGQRGDNSPLWQGVNSCSMHHAMLSACNGGGMAEWCVVAAGARQQHNHVDVTAPLPHCRHF